MKKTTLFLCLVLMTASCQTTSDSAQHPKHDLFRTQIGERCVMQETRGGYRLPGKSMDRIKISHISSNASHDQVSFFFESHQFTAYFVNDKVVACGSEAARKLGLI